jgi:hypothetical protein
MLECSYVGSTGSIHISRPGLGDGEWSLTDCVPSMGDHEIIRRRSQARFSDTRARRLWHDPYG